MTFKAIKFQEIYEIRFGDDSLFLSQYLYDVQFCHQLKISMYDYYHEMIKLPGAEISPNYKTAPILLKGFIINVICFKNLKDANNAINYLNDKYSVALNLILSNNI